MSWKKVFVWIFLISLLISSLIIFGTVDRDFYAFYYVGRGVADGNDMYRDFGDNKGPILYLFFALLNLIFKQRYDLALISASAVTDAVAVFLLLLVIMQELKLKADSLFLRWWSSCLLTAWYKTFSIGPAMAGVYSESLAMILALYALWLRKRTDPFWSGVMMGLAILTRQTAYVFTIFLFLIYVIEGFQLKKLIRYLIGVILPVFITVVWFYLNGTLNYYWENAGELNLIYIKGIGNYQRIVSGLSITILQPSTGVGLLFTVFGLLLYTVFKFRSKNRKSLLTLWLLFLTCSFSILTGGYVYFHHFSQMALIFFWVFAVVIENKFMRLALLPLLAALAVSIGFNYFLYLSNNKSIASLYYNHVPIKELSTKEYLIPFPYYPDFYFKYNMKPPPEYMRQYTSAKNLLSKTGKIPNGYKYLWDDHINKTLFLAVATNSFDIEEIKHSYLALFNKQFRIKKIRNYYDGGAIIGVYTAEKY